MKHIETFGDLLNAIKNCWLEGLSPAAYVHLEDILERYLNYDEESEVPLLLCHRVPNKGDELYWDLLATLSLPPDFWSYVHTCAIALTQPDAMLYNRCVDAEAMIQVNRAAGQKILDFIAHREQVPVG